MPEVELKPCPFCGCDRVWMRAVEYDTCINIIRCPDCKMEFTTPAWSEGHKSNNRDRTVEAWNRRATRHARWIKIDEDCRGYSSIYDCSGCGGTTYLELPAKECDYDFCPGCGAEMDGGDSDG